MKSDKIPLEIERKWILSGTPEMTTDPDNILSIHQFYNPDGWRYRRVFDSKAETIRFFKTKKEKESHGVAKELELEIKESVWFSKRSNATGEVVKKRCIFERNGLKWEVDIFHSVHLIMMEVELGSIDQKIKIPNFLKDLVIMEVTGMEQFNNSSLAKKLI